LHSICTLYIYVNVHIHTCTWHSCKRLPFKSVSIVPFSFLFFVPDMNCFVYTYIRITRLRSTAFDLALFYSVVPFACSFSSQICTLLYTYKHTFTYTYTSRTRTRCMSGAKNKRNIQSMLRAVDITFLYTYKHTYTYTYIAYLTSTALNIALTVFSFWRQTWTFLYTYKHTYTYTNITYVTSTALNICSIVPYSFFSFSRQIWAFLLCAY